MRSIREKLIALAVGAMALGSDSQAQEPRETRAVIASEGWDLIGDLARPDGSAGSRAPAVLLLNGAGSDRTDYRALARELSRRGIGSLRLDLRAMGESINRGRFIPFDTTGRNDSLALDRTFTDVQAALRWLAARPWVDPQRIGALGASFSGEALAEAIRDSAEPRAVVALSPGSFSERSLAAIDGDGRRWLFVFSAREGIVRRRGMDRWVRQGTTQARVIVVPDSGHASGLLAVSPFLAPRIAEWLSRALGVEPLDPRWRTAADRVAGTLQSEADDLLRPGVETHPLGNGLAGRLRFLLAWHQARRDSASARAAVAATDRLVRLSASDSVGPSLYAGLGGTALTLLEAADVLDRPTYRSHGVLLLERIRRAGRAEGDRAWWSSANDVMFGDAGSALVFFAAGRRSADGGLPTLAFAAARSLLARARPDSGGRNWLRAEDPPHYVLPNFSHGAAGIGTVLALMARDQRAPAELLSAAAGAARYVLAVSRRDARGFRVPYGWPIPDGGWDRPFDASWAHGQAGTARLFWELWRATRDSNHLAVVHDAVTALDSARVLGTPLPEYGAAPFSFDYRFGLAGIADFLADLYDETGDRRYLARAVRLAETIVAQADTGRATLGWTVPRMAFMSDPGRPALLTGMLHGSTGPGLLFLKLDALFHGGRPPAALPDSPFGDD